MSRAAMLTAPFKLRDCPMCHEPPNDAGDGVVLTSESLLDPETGEAFGDMGFTVRCCACGVSVSAEWIEEVVRLWNGEPPRLAPDEEEGA